ncbi:MAG: InlB B-repeat-containing protein, partial [Clostridia bacterium]|nr:InlB B-repeat-containing protein [Clostridia bacterium]
TTIDTTSVAYGETPTHADPAVPASYDAEHYTYTFTGWTPEIAAVTGEATYTAQFTQTAKSYTITFVTDGSAVADITELYGTEVTLSDSEKDGFHFEGWYADSAYAADSKVTSPYTLTGDVTLYAYFEALSLSSEAVEEAIATATAGVSGTCYTAATYEAYQSALAAVRAFKDQHATAENLTAYNNALTALDNAVAGLAVEHAYTGEPSLTRPVKDADTGEWGTGTYTWTCANDAGHPVKTEPVNRANYTQYDAVLAQINTLLEEDYTDDVISALTTAKTAMEAIQQDYVVPEQAQLDAAIQAILNTLGENDKITVNEDGNITVSDDAYKTYTLTVSNNVNSSTLTYTKKAGEQVVLTLTLAGYTFKSWNENANLNAETGVYTFPAADDTITAQYVKDLTGNETIAAAQAIITDANDPDTGSDYDGDYIDDLEDLLDELDVIKNDPTKLDDVEELLEDIQELVNAADSNKLYTITWVIDGATETTKVKVGDTPTHAAPTKEGYHFTGWDPAIVAVTGDATYTAQFEENVTGAADYEEYDELFAILEVLKDNDAILPELLEEINDKVDNPLPRDLTADQQDTIDAEVEEIKALLDRIVEKDGNGDYTTSVKESALVHCTVTFYWLTTKLTKTVIKGDPVAAPNVTAMYGVEGMESGHYVFDKWTIKGSDSTDFDLESIAGDLELEGHYKLEAHTGSWVEHPATCSNVSWHEIDCTTCGMHFKANTGTEKAPHDWNDWVVVEATCAHPGSRTRTCKNDPSHKETEVIPQLNHTDADGDTICDVCGNPTEAHQHTDANGDGKCDTCGAKTNVHAHTDGNNDGVCDGCGSNMDGSFRCNLCSFWEQYKGVPVFGWFVIIIHYIYHLIAQITSWR